MTCETWLFSFCEAFFVWLVFLLVFTGKTFPFKNLENAKEERERKAHPGS